MHLVTPILAGESHARLKNVAVKPVGHMIPSTPPAHGKHSNAGRDPPVDARVRLQRNRNSAATGGMGASCTGAGSRDRSSSTSTDQNQFRERNHWPAAQKAGRSRYRAHYHSRVWMGAWPGGTAKKLSGLSVPDRPWESIRRPLARNPGRRVGWSPENRKRTQRLSGDLLEDIRIKRKTTPSASTASPPPSSKMQPKAFERRGS